MADNPELIDWQPEEIPPSNKLYMRVHRSFAPNGDFLVGVFRDQGGAMSTDWEKYSTPADTKNRAKRPEENGVIEMLAGDASAIEGIVVRHTPDVIRRVRAHTDVIGDKKNDPEIRVKLKRISSWVAGYTVP